MTIREQIEAMEKETLSPYAALSANSKGRDRVEDECDIRPVFIEFTSISRILSCPTNSSKLLGLYFL